MIAIAPDLTLRPERLADLPFTLALYGEGRAQELAVTSWPAATKAAFLQAQFDLRSAHYSRAFPDADRWIVEDCSGPMGRLCVDRPRTGWHIVDIALLTAAQGRGQGTRLLEWLLTQASTAAVPSMELHVGRDNPRAAALYRRLGFATVPGNSATHWRMRWALS